jgi:hypothetical protein
MYSQTKLPLNEFTRLILKAQGAWPVIRGQRSIV